MALAVAKPTYRAPRLAAQVRNHKTALIPAPVFGLDSSRPLTDQDPRSATVMNNFIARRFGSELRGGYKRHTTNLGGVGTESPVATLMSYLPPRSAGSTFLSRLFAACENGNIYDVTSQTSEATVPGVAQAVAGQTEPGWFSHVNFATANTNYLCIASAGGGYWTYDNAGGWVNRTASVTGTAGANATFDFVMVWKSRLWFIGANSTLAWYLGVGAIAGAATSFDFGPLLTHGGELRAMASWTIDSGDGIDDKLVIAGAGGDILVYGGTDPTSVSTFGLIGRWYVGPPPSGRRFMGKYGGDLGIVCETGVEYMSRVLQAQGLLDPETVTSDSVSRRFNEAIGSAVRDTRGAKGWTALHVPQQEAVILITPYDTAATNLQFCFSTMPVAWTTFSGMPAQCAEVFEGAMYFGMLNGRIGKAFSADTDDELTTGTAGVDVIGSMQTAFIAPNDDRMSLKRPLLIMPMVQSPEPPSLLAQVNTEWSSLATPGSPPFAPSGSSLWDVSLWDIAVWSGALNTYLLWIGATGLGCYMSLRLSLIGKRGTIFTSWKLVYEPGGIM